jgi:pseudouridine kinase
MKVLQETADCGVCIDHVLKAEERLTGTYIALLDNMGEMTAALSDMSILEMLDVLYFKSKKDILEKAAYIICDANLPDESIKYIISTANSYCIPVCLEPVSVKKAQKLKDCLKGIDFITPNLDELAALTGMDAQINKAEHMAAQLVKSGVCNIITTLGKDGLCFTNENESRHFCSIPTVVSDVTGAGDSLTAGFFYGLMKYGNVEKALACGLASAALTLSSKETVNPLLSEDEVDKLSSQCSLYNML